MNSFRFPLERVLEWRATELQMAEERFRVQSAELARLEQVRAALEAEFTGAEAAVRHAAAPCGGDFAALDAFRLHIRAEEDRLARDRADRLRGVEECRRGMLEARRRCRLLERLKERRFEEWRTESARELEQLASEAFLARWPRAGG
jgi:flagellar export protein FliJ